MTRPQIKAAGESSGQPAPLVAPASGDLTTGDQKPATAFSPGPWTPVDNGQYWEIQTPSHGQVGDACASKFIYINGELLPQEIAEPIAEANARLIAAAPDMYEALKAQEKAIADLLLDLNDSVLAINEMFRANAIGRFLHERTRVRAALAKAEGKQ